MHYTSVSIVVSPEPEPRPLRSGLCFIPGTPVPTAKIVMVITAFRAVSGHPASEWRIAINAEFDRDLTSRSKSGYRVGVPPG